MTTVTTVMSVWEVLGTIINSDKKVHCVYKQNNTVYRYSVPCFQAELWIKEL